MTDPSQLHSGAEGSNVVHANNDANAEENGEAQRGKEDAAANLAAVANGSGLLEDEGFEGNEDTETKTDQ